jgi:hypothetical protein
LPPALRETALGGVVATKEGLRLKGRFFEKNNRNFEY